MVGTADNAKQFGIQPWSDIKPRPLVQEIPAVQWCEAEFHAVTMIKGSMTQETRRLVWGQYPADCGAALKGTETKRPTWLVWLLREEKGVLRPIRDGSGFFIELYGQWENAPGRTARERVGLSLLTPSSVTDQDSEYPQLIVLLGGIACELLGKDDCIRHLQLLADTDRPELRDKACKYLAQQGAECVPRSATAMKK